MKDMSYLIEHASESDIINALDSIDVNVVNEYKQSLLHEAIASNRKSVALALIQKNIDLNIGDKKNQTALHYAAHRKMTALAIALVQAGADMNCKDIYGNNPLWTATFSSKGTDYDVVRILVEAGADPYHKNRAGRSAMDFANQIGDRTLVAILSKENV